MVNVLSNPVITKHCPSYNLIEQFRKGRAMTPWSLDPSHVARVAWRFKLFFEHKWSGKVFSLPGSSRLWGLLSRFARLKTAKLRRLLLTKGGKSDRQASLEDGGSEE